MILYETHKYYGYWLIPHFRQHQAAKAAQVQLQQQQVAQQQQAAQQQQQNPHLRPNPAAQNMINKHFQQNSHSQQGIYLGIDISINTITFLSV